MLPTQTPPPPLAPRGRNLALLLLAVALPIGAVYASLGTPATHRGGDLLVFYTAGRVNLTGRNPYNAGKIETDDPAFRAFAADFQAWSRRPGSMPKYVWRWQSGMAYLPPSFLALHN